MFKCDSNFNERNRSFAPLELHEIDGEFVIVNTAASETVGTATEKYLDLETAAKNRGFVNRWMRSL